MNNAEQRAIISGIGQSAVGRRLGRDEPDLTIEAAPAAIADAGLTVAEIDGLATYLRFGHRRRVGQRGTGHAHRAGRPAPVAQLAQRQSRRPRADPGGHQRGDGGRGRAPGTCSCTARSPSRPRKAAAGERGSVSAPPDRRPFQWSLPFRAYSAANWLAMNAQRHFHEFGTTREQMAQIALNDRA